MIDDAFEVMTLLNEIKEELPLEAYPSRDLVRGEPGLRKLKNSDRIRIVDAIDGGDAAGILCVIESEKIVETEAHCVSITHLRIPPVTPLAKAINRYQSKRIKRLKRMNKRR
ncbi:MAG: Ni,Fe-hydrogenase maturation factor [Verrucomicrobiales bacterium]|jgi:Ni,Fe-hydrogenase maturation factor